MKKPERLSPRFHQIVVSKQALKYERLENARSAAALSDGFVDGDMFSVIPVDLWIGMLFGPAHHEKRFAFFVKGWKSKDFQPSLRQVGSALDLGRAQVWCDLAAGSTLGFWFERAGERKVTQGLCP